MKGKDLFWIVGLALLWGPSFLFVRVAVQEIPPLTIATLRVLLGAMLLYSLMRINGYRFKQAKVGWRQFAIMGLFANALPFSLLSWGQQSIDSALAAMIIGTMPIFTMLFSHFFVKGAALTSRKMMGGLIGFVGLLFLLAPALFGGVQATLLGVVAAIGAAVSYSISIIYGGRNLKGLPPYIAPTAQLVTASVFLLPVALIVEKPFTLPMPSFEAVGAILLLTGLSTVLAFVVYYRAIEHINPTNVSLIAYLNPVVASILGFALLGEQFGWQDFVGYGLIVMSALIINQLIRFPSIGHLLKPEWKTVDGRLMLGMRPPKHQGSFLQ